MDTKKRRIVYLSDTEWEELKRAANEIGQTISAFLREKALQSDVTVTVSDPKGELPAAVERTFRPAPKPSQKGK